MPPSTGYAVATIDNPSSALTDFTLLVDLSRMPNDWWTEAENTDKTRGRVFKDDGTTELAVDWLFYDHGAETGWLRCEYSGSLATSGTQKIRIYPPVAANATVGVSDTYGQYNAYDANWKTYLTDGSASPASRQDGKSWTRENATSGATGQVGDAWDFEATEGNNRITLLEESLPVEEHPMSFCAWFKMESHSATEEHMMMCWQNSNVGNFADFIAFRIDDTGGTGDVQLNRRENNGTTRSATTTINPTVGVFQWACATFSAADAAAVRLNNANEGTSSDDSEPRAGEMDMIRIGQFKPTSDEFDGILDELQAHNVARSDAWFAHEFSQSDDQSAFWGTWTWEGGGPAPTPELFERGFLRGVQRGIMRGGL